MTEYAKHDYLYKKISYLPLQNIRYIIFKTKYIKIYSIIPRSFVCVDKIILTIVKLLL